MNSNTKKVSILLIGVALAGASCGSSADSAPGSGTTVAGAGPVAATTTAGTSGKPAATAGTSASAVGTTPSGGTKASAGSAAPAAPGGSAGARASAAGAPGSAQAGSPGSAAGHAGDHAVGGSGGASAPAAGSGADTSNLEKFSFFVTSWKGLQRLSKSDKGFGGDLRYGQLNGLEGADKICSELAESSMPGAAAKGWRAFLSASKGADGKVVNAIERIGDGPWYDRAGRTFAMNKAALMSARPQGADPAIINDFPNEDGIPNKRPDPAQGEVNNHHVLTGSDTSGKLYMPTGSTCNDWTSTAQNAGRPRIGFSYPAGNRQNWMSGQDEGGCGAGAVLVDNGPSDPNNPIVGSGGGYGGFYCFALKP